MRLAGRSLAITMTSSDHDRDPQVQQLERMRLERMKLERMKNDFLVAHQRRRERGAASRRGDTGDGPPLLGLSPMIRRASPPCDPDANG